MIPREMYESLSTHLHMMIMNQFKSVGNTKIDATFELPYNTMVRVVSSQKKDIKVDLQLILINKINNLELSLKNSNNFYEKNENFHKLVIYKEILQEVDKIV